MTRAAALARVLVVGFWLATAAYAFLMSVPFVYEQFLQPGLVPALVAFARWHGVLAVLAAGLAAIVVGPERQRPEAAGRVRTLVGLSWLAAVAILVASPLTSLEPGLVARAVSVAALAPVVLLAGIDLALAPWMDHERRHDPCGRDLAVAAASAATCVLLFATPGAISAGALDVHGPVLSLTSHGLLFAAVFAVFTMVRSFGDVTFKPSQWEAMAAVAMVTTLLGVVAMLIIPQALSLRDGGSKAVVFVFGATIGLTLAARGVRVGAVPERDGIALALSGALPRWARSASWIARTAWVAVLLVFCALRAGSVAMDWNFVVAKLGAVIVWVVTLATAAVWMPRRIALSPVVTLAACLAWLAIHLAVAGRLPVGPVTVEAATRAGDAWAVGDPSFRTLRDWLHRSALDEGGASTADGGVAFYDFLQAHTNIGRSIDVAPVPVRLADLSARPTARAPHVFVFVVDSLRRDYVSPYNPAVTFTPAIGRFAADSTVFTRAFTRYGATGLSVPSIWVGGMIVHKQYVTPFAPMNALHALLDHHGYARWMSMDNIVEVIMPRGETLDELDRRRGVADFRMCTSIDELRGRLDRLAAARQPTFVWTLPQDVHVAVVTREGQTTLDGGGYDGFNAPYASRVRRLDECFGGFVDDLKARGLYDDSLIVLTADHGDSLGEEGRWGHAYTLYPEVVQVPLIVHLPAYARDGLQSDASAIAFTTDITPTLYSLLGHAVTAEAPIFGRPLFWPEGETRPARPPFGLMASSYGSVYAWVDERGQEMYIADGVGLRDYAYTLDGSPAGRSAPVSAAARAAGQQAIRDGIAAIAGYYAFTPPSQ